MSLVLLGLGSNLGNSAQYIQMGLKLLSDQIAGLRVSSLYRTAPRDYTNQDYFLNVCVTGEYPESPMELLSVCQNIETRLYRQRDNSQPKGPRTIDVDIIEYEGNSITHPDLTLPHPRAKDRRFVIIPLLELFPPHHQYKISPSFQQRIDYYRRRLEQLPLQGVYYASLQKYEYT